MKNAGSSVLAITAGVLGAVVVLAFLPPLTSRLNLAVAQVDSGRYTATGVLLLLLGTAIGIICVAAVWNPLAAVIPAAVMLAIYGPFYANLELPAWFPERLERLVLESAGPVPPVIAGVLLGASAVSIAAKALRRTRDESGVLVGNPSN